MSDDISINSAKNYIKGVLIFYMSISEFIISSIAKYKKIVLLFSLIGAIFGVLISSLETPFYEAKATFYYIELNKKIYGEMLDKLRILAKNKSNKSLSKELGISEKEASEVIDIEGLNIAGSSLAEDITEVKLPFYIKVKLLDNTISEKVLVRLEAYLNSNPVGSQIITNNKIKLKRRIIFLDSEIRKLDSLKTAFNYYLTHKEINSRNMLNNLSITEIFKKSEELFIEKTDLELTLPNYKAVHILDKFVIEDKPITSKPLKELIQYLLIGLFTGIAMSVILNAIKKVKH